MTRFILSLVLLLLPSFVYAQNPDDNLVLVGRIGEKTPAHEPCKVADSNCDPSKLKIVEVAPFYIDRYETTYRDVKKCLDAGLCKNMSKFKLALDYTDALESKLELPFAMDHDEASAYCKARGMRLPTPAEWLLAAMGTSIKPYPWEEETSTPGMYADTPSKVGEFPHDVSPWGVSDMAGNALEWVQGNPMGSYDPENKCMDSRTWPAMGNVRRVRIYEQFGVGLLGDEDGVVTARCVKTAK